VGFDYSFCLLRDQSGQSARQSTTAAWLKSVPMRSRWQVGEETTAQHSSLPFCCLPLSKQIVANEKGPEMPPHSWVIGLRASRCPYRGGTKSNMLQHAALSHPKCDFSPHHLLCLPRLAWLPFILPCVLLARHSTIIGYIVYLPFPSNSAQTAKPVMHLPQPLANLPNKTNSARMAMPPILEGLTLPVNGGPAAASFSRKEVIGGYDYALYRR
jgi:hypothetical protein